MKFILLAFRSLRYFRAYSALNVLGLTLSLVCVVVIFRYVYGELTVDHFHSRLERMYVTYVERAGESKRSFSGLYNPNKEESFVDLSKHPGVERHALFYKQRGNELVYGERILNADIIVADTNFMQVCGYHTEGAANLLTPEDALITEDFARKLFGHADPVGKTIRYTLIGKELTITGVIEQPRMKSSLSFDLVISVESYTRRWPSVPQSLILLYPGTNYQDINAQYASFEFMRSHVGEVRYQLYPYRDVYFGKEIDGTFFSHNNYLYIIVFLIVGLLLLLTGLVNFVSIYTVVSLHRGREFGLKKVYGASGWHVFIQLFAENFVLIALSLLLSLGLAEISNPFVRNVLAFEQMTYVEFDLYLTLALLLVLPFLTSVFPYYHYTRSAPIRAIRQLSERGNGLHVFRRMFLLFQYVVTFTLIILSLFFVRQLHAMLHADLGYRTEHLIKAPFLQQTFDYTIASDESEAMKKEKQLRDEIKQKLDASPLITQWIRGESPNATGYNNIEFRKAGGTYQEVTLFAATGNWLKQFDIQLLDGRVWESGEYLTYNLLVNESALKQFGISDFRETMLEASRKLWFTLEDIQAETMPNPPYHIIGVVRDFYPSHLSQWQPPIILYPGGTAVSAPVIASYPPEREKEVVAFMQQLHDETVGGEFTYSLIADEVAAVYREDRRVATIYSLFSLIAIIVSSIGLFSLSLFDVRRQRKNITIRKINGATTREITVLLLKQYLFLLGVAFVVAIPLSWLAITRYLEGFAFQTPISWWLFAVALVITAGISLLTLVWQIRQAASTNPAETIKTE
jgi:ABC-type antimicrobial peptide transport system permease subunit